MAWTRKKKVQRYGPRMTEAHIAESSRLAGLELDRQIKSGERKTIPLPTEFRKKKSLFQRLVQKVKRIHCW